MPVAVRSWTLIPAHVKYAHDTSYVCFPPTQVEDVSLDFEELLECIARCGVDKYRSIDQINLGGKVSAMIQNLLGDANEEQVITAATYIKAERFKPTGGEAEVLAIWDKLKLDTLPGFPLWEKAVFDVIADKYTMLASIFRAYSANSLVGSATEMDMEEFHDFVVEANLITDAYGFDTMTGQFTKANAGSNVRKTAAKGAHTRTAHTALTHSRPPPAPDASDA